MQLLTGAFAYTNWHKAGMLCWHCAFEKRRPITSPSPPSVAAYVCLQENKLSSNWEVEFFRGVALDFWRLAIMPEQTRAEVEFLLGALNGRAGSQLLDVPCGNGRHSIGLAASGCHVTG